jgi:hypothetical protein
VFSASTPSIVAMASDARIVASDSAGCGVCEASRTIPPRMHETGADSAGLGYAAEARLRSDLSLLPELVGIPGSARWSGNGRKYRQGDESGKDGLHGHLQRDLLFSPPRC